MTDQPETCPVCGYPVIGTVCGTPHLLADDEATPAGEVDCLAVLAWWQAETIRQGKRAERAEEALAGLDDGSRWHRHDGWHAHGDPERPQDAGSWHTHALTATGQDQP